MANSWRHFSFRRYIAHRIFNMDTWNTVFPDRYCTGNVEKRQDWNEDEETVHVVEACSLADSVKKTPSCVAGFYREMKYDARILKPIIELQSHMINTTLESEITFELALHWIVQSINCHIFTRSVLNWKLNSQTEKAFCILLIYT